MIGLNDIENEPIGAMRLPVGKKWAERGKACRYIHVIKTAAFRRFHYRVPS